MISMQYDLESFTIDFFNRENTIYSVTLARLTSSGQLLDTILQLHQKTWCDPVLLHDFVTLLQKKVDYSLQGHFCPFGRNMRDVDVYKLFGSEELDRGL